MLNNKPFYIAVDGLGGSGKSTLLKEFEKDAALDCCLLKFPDYNTPTGELIHSILMGRMTYPEPKVFNALYTLNRTSMAKQIKEAMLLERNIVVDRSHLCSAAMQSGFAEKWEDQDDYIRWSLKLEEEGNYPRPHQSFFIDVNVEDMVNAMEAREKAGGEGKDAHEQSIVQMEKIRTSYLRLCDMGLMTRIYPYSVKDGRRFSPKELKEFILEYVKSYL